jgi:hypothetical protein
MYVYTYIHNACMESHVAEVVTDVIELYTIGMRTYTHMHTHTYIHTHTQVQIQTSNQPRICSTTTKQNHTITSTTSGPSCFYKSDLHTHTHTHTHTYSGTNQTNKPAKHPAPAAGHPASTDPAAGVGFAPNSHGQNLPPTIHAAPIHAATNQPQTQTQTSGGHAQVQNPLAHNPPNAATHMQQQQQQQQQQRPPQMGYIPPKSGLIPATKVIRVPPTTLPVNMTPLVPQSPSKLAPPSTWGSGLVTLFGGKAKAKTNDKKAALVRVCVFLCLVCMHVCIYVCVCGEDK